MNENIAQFIGNLKIAAINIDAFLNYTVSDFAKQSRMILLGNGSIKDGIDKQLGELRNISDSFGITSKNTKEKFNQMYGEELKNNSSSFVNFIRKIPGLRRFDQKSLILMDCARYNFYIPNASQYSTPQLRTLYYLKKTAKTFDTKWIERPDLTPGQMKTAFDLYKKMGYINVDELNEQNKIYFMKKGSYNKEELNKRENQLKSNATSCKSYITHQNSNTTITTDADSLKENCLFDLDEQLKKMENNLSTFKQEQIFENDLIR